MNNRNFMGETLDEVYRIFDVLNKKYFEDKLPAPVFTVQPTRKKVLGWCSVRKEWKPTTSDVKEDRYEINICSQHLQSDVIFIVETILHEMIHLDNLVKDVQDCSADGYYHNKKFKKAAEAHGLVCEEWLGFDLTF